MLSIKQAVMRMLYLWLLATVGGMTAPVYGQVPGWKLPADNPDYLHRAIKEITDVMVHDVYSPPVASRTYAYISVAAYEAARYQDPSFISLAAQLHQLSAFEQPDPDKQYNFSVAAVNAVLLTGKTMVISEETVDAFRQRLLKEMLATGLRQEVFDNSVEFGKKIAGHVLNWAAQDNYRQTRAFPKYSVKDDDDTWIPTPPVYMKAVEPYWGKVRTFLIDSAMQFMPLKARVFSTDTSSAFYKDAVEVQQAGLALTEEQVAMANFWDCNPFKMNINGHVMYATKKISPGGHWMNIARLVCRQANAGLARTAEAYAFLSVAMADAFISCWDEKYRSKVIRPETYINRYISQGWMPLLQTPPFPEYTSGHSVVSAAASVILTRLFGEKFAYADSTETEFDIPVRRFNSFSQAAAEAGISRLYGGIHYMPSIENGMIEGEAIGQFFSARLHTRRQTAVANTTQQNKN